MQFLPRISREAYCKATGLLGIKKLFKLNCPLGEREGGRGGENVEV